MTKNYEQDRIEAWCRLHSKAMNCKLTFGYDPRSFQRDTLIFHLQNFAGEMALAHWARKRRCE